MDAAVWRSRFNDVGKAAFWVALALNIVTTLITSGINASLINNLIAASNPGTADVQGYVDIFSVIFATAPIIAAFIISFWVVITDTISEGIAKAGLIAVIFFGSGVLALLVTGSSLDLMGQAWAGSTGHPLVRIFIAGAIMLFSPYSWLLIIQAAVVTAGILFSWSWLSDRWKPAVRPAA